MQNYTINVFGPSYWQFFKDYQRLVDPGDGSKNLTFALEDILMCMNYEEITYFKVPSNHTKDHRWHTFKFRVENNEYIYEGYE